MAIKLILLSPFPESAAVFQYVQIPLKAAGESGGRQHPAVY
jgi:hypothetical protein